MLNIIKKIFGTKYDRDVKEYSPVVEKINAFFKEYNSLSNDELRNKTFEFRNRISEYLSGIDADIASLKEKAEDESDLGAREEFFDEIDKINKDRDKALEVILKKILPEAFAVVKETARRFTENEEIIVTVSDTDRDLAGKGRDYVSINGEQAVWKNEWDAAGAKIKWNMIHYDVQLIGGMVLHDGKIAEMATGEGKTLVATLPAYLNGLTGLGMNVITVNDYLARRDQEWVGPIFEFLHLTVDCIDKHRPHSPGRKKAYRSDITYGTNNEFGFDYLRDNMVSSEAELVQSKHHFAMIDEVDSVLIDDARTPLIISGPVPKGSEEQEYQALNPKVLKLHGEQKKLATKYLAEAKKLLKDGITGYNEGEAGLSLLRAFRALPKYRPLIKFLSEDGVKQELQKAENFYMQEQSKNMHIADEPLLFTINEKTRSVNLTEKGAEFLSKGESDDGFFVMPDITSEMQAIEESEELTDDQKSEYKENLIRDYTAKSKRLHSTNQLLKAYTLFEKDTDYVVMEGQVKIVDEQTGRMMEGRRYSDGLHQALEAKENVKIGEITQTYATVTLQNYFRMYHKLAGMTGTAETEAGEFWEIYKLDVVVIPTNRPIIRDDRNDLIYKTEKEKFNAVIEDIVKYSEEGRPVLVGTTSVDISEKLSRILNLRGIKHNILNAKQHQREAEIVAEAGKRSAVTIATNMAGRGTDIKLSDEIKSIGGLAIIATERHDSRRVDRQLMGRSGRQGDPGSSQFYVSLEDRLMRIFGGERVSKIMDRLGLKEGEVIQNSMITKNIISSQKKVEENHFGTRKRLLEFDDVMNIQREAIYGKRNNALSGDRLSVDLYNRFMDLTENILVDYKQGGSYEDFINTSILKLGVDPDIDAAEWNEAPVEKLLVKYQNQVIEQYEKKKEQINNALYPTIKNVHENEGHRYKRILIPFTDGRKNPLPVSADMQQVVDTEGNAIMLEIEKALTLALIDENWKEHLRHMDELKESSQAASFEQKDPLVIYKMEAFNLFQNVIGAINEDVCSYLMNGKVIVRDNVQEAAQQKTDLSKTRTSREQQAARSAAENAGRARKVVEQFVRQEQKVGRNEPCPCGSGKKYKSCHGK
jgi:preprotein translocase subunit SecA